MGYPEKIQGELHLISVIFFSKSLNFNLIDRKMDKFQWKNVVQNRGCYTRPSVLLTSVKVIKHKETTETVIAKRTLRRHDNEVQYGILDGLLE